MIPSTKKEWTKLFVESSAKEIAWNALDDYDRKIYLNEAKKTTSKCGDRLSIFGAEHIAKKLMWNELSKKEQNLYRSRAQKRNH